MKKILFLTITPFLLTIEIPPLQAQTPIRELRNNYGITISGVVKSIVGNEFILDDGTGEIIVDAGPRWYHKINLSQGERVTVVGEYDDEDFDAYKITRSNGEIIQIRSGPGRPPWAGGPNRRDQD